MSTRPGLLISLEGGEGAGKSTVLAALGEHLAQCGLPVVRVREPGGTPLGEALRGLLLDPGQTLAAETELLLMFASRAELLHRVIDPALARGAAVLCDRFTDASFAYQGGGRGLPMGWIAELERRVVRRRPDLTLLLDVEVELGLARTRSRGEPADRIEIEQADFFARVRTTYLARAAAEPERIVRIDAAQPVDGVRAAAIAALERTLAARQMERLTP